MENSFRKCILNKIPICVFIFLFCSYKTPIHCKLSDKIFFPYNKKLRAEKPISLVGKGGAMWGNIQKVNSTYHSQERMNVDEARRLYVDIAEGYIERYNQNEAVRPYLDNYPVTMDNFEIMIGFRDPAVKAGRNHMGDGYVALMFYIDKKKCLYYEGYDPATEEYYTLHEESYETARDIVLKERALCE